MNIQIKISAPHKRAYIQLISRAIDFNHEDKRVSFIIDRQLCTITSICIRCCLLATCNI